jgi:hypothetical protein
MAMKTHDTGKGGTTMAMPTHRWIGIDSGLRAVPACPREELACRT